MMPATPRTQFDEGRSRAERELASQQRRAVRTVAGNARDGAEFTALLAMLGLDNPMSQRVPLDKRLADYVRQVAVAVGVSADAVSHEVTDTATAYIPLDRRSATQPEHDLMLVWDELLGWYVAAETAPTETPVVIGYLVGELVPPPSVVARFAAEVAEGGDVDRIRPVPPTIERAVLAERMAAH
ncbi:DUF6292 family protein [Actinophytocola sp. NPDC049390]|uniref:DUF6292 family protein n=1 Tax=Actinophytocola sp. NPDC049390 TaxID=3363894 RepID=UPI003798BC43